MNQKIARITGFSAALAVSATALVLTTGVAEAATCSASSDNVCVRVSNRSNDVDSIRVNGRCLLDSDSGMNTYPKAQVSRTGVPTVLTYTGRRCEDGTQNSASVLWGSATGPDGFRTVYISNP